MKLLELVSYFRKGGSLEEFCEKESLDFESEVIEVFMQKPFDVGADIVFFEIEKTEGNVEFVKDDIVYYNMFDFYYFLDVIEDSNKNKYMLLSDEEISKKLLFYAIYDA